MLSANAGSTLGAANTCCAGGPLQFSGDDAPEVAKYARYPAVDYYDVFDEGFNAGCPVNSINFTAYGLEVKLPPKEWHTHFCWVIGTLAVRSLALLMFPVLLLQLQACTTPASCKREPYFDRLFIIASPVLQAYQCWCKRHAYLQCTL